MTGPASTLGGGGSGGEPSWLTVVRLVARRELVERAREKSFLVSTGITLLVLLAVVVLPPLLGFGDAPSYRVGFAPEAQAAAEPARALADELGVDLEVASVEPDAVTGRLDGGDLDAYVTTDAVRVPDDLPDDLGLVIQEASRDARASQRLRQAGLDPAAVEEAQSVPPLAVEAVDPPDPGAGSRGRIAFVGTLLLYGQLVGYGFWVALGVVEEKSSRVVEVLLATVRPRALLAGKIIGIGLLGLLQLLVVAVVGLGAASATGAVDVGSEAVGPVLLVLGWFVLGFAFYACLFAGAAARVSRQEDVQAVTTPGTMAVLVSFFAALYASNEPDAPAARVLGVVPPFSALVSPARAAAGEVPAWESALAVALMLVAIAALVVVAARVYEGSVLRMGGTVSMREAWRSRHVLGRG